MNSDNNGKTDNFDIDVKAVQDVTKNKGINGRVLARTITEIAIMSALLTSLKFALSFLPNIEVVTLLCLVFAYHFGRDKALCAVFVFCTIEVLIYGVGSWVLLYFVYFPSLTLLSTVLFKIGFKRLRILKLLIFVAVMNAVFGLMSAVCEMLFALPNLAPDDVWKYFSAYYIKGIYFDLVHIVSNVFIVGAMFVPLTKALGLIKRDRAHGQIVE